MNHYTRVQRALASGGAALCLMLVLPTSPAFADGVDVGEARNGGVVLPSGDHGGAPDGVDRGEARNGGTDGYLPRGGAPEGVDVGRQLNSIENANGDGQPTSAQPGDPVVDERSVEYLQIALGALGGAALLALALAAMHRRARHHIPGTA